MNSESLRKAIDRVVVVAVVRLPHQLAQLLRARVLHLGGEVEIANAVIRVHRLGAAVGGEEHRAVRREEELNIYTLDSPGIGERDRVLSQKESAW